MTNSYRFIKLGAVLLALMTALDAIEGHPEITGRERPKGDRYSRDFRGPNWLDQRDAAQAYERIESGRQFGKVVVNWT